MLYRIQSARSCGYEGDYGRGVLDTGRAQFRADDLC